MSTNVIANASDNNALYVYTTLLRSFLVVHCIFTAEWHVFGKQLETLTVKELMH